YLVRHGKAAASFSEARDPGLDEAGAAQAEAMAERLAPLGPLPIISSPLRRTRETAMPLERRWRFTARVEPAVGEIPSPSDDPPDKSRDGLTSEQLHTVPAGHPRANTIAWNLWHYVRTEDNVVRFALQNRRPTVWVEGGYPERLGLHPAAQGTGMSTAEAQAL